MKILSRIGMSVAGVLAIGVAAVAFWSAGVKGDAPPQADPIPPGAKLSVPASEEPGAARCQVAFLGPTGMKVGWQVFGRPAREFVATPIQAPARLGFGPGATYRLKLADIPGRPATTLYPTLEIPTPSPATATFLAHAEIPIQFTPEDFDQAFDGEALVVKVIYLPDLKHQEAAVGGIETLVTTRLEPGADPVREAAACGSLLAVVRLGRISMEQEQPGPMPAPIEKAPQTVPPVGPATFRGEFRPTPPGPTARVDARPCVLEGVRSPVEIVGHGI